MTRPMVRIHNVELDEIIDREMNDEEFAQYEIDLAAQQAQEAEQVFKDQTKAALLARLGITAEEAALLLS